MDHPTNLDTPNAAELASLDELLLDAEQLGRLMRLTTSIKPGAAAAAVNQRLHRGYPMPPPLDLHGTRRRVWLRNKVIEWLISRQTKQPTDS
tara:strand:+ start:1602 stop:1877 length:276 start_codon:yes stop_codon:yes gene_type:complete